MSTTSPLTSLPSRATSVGRPSRRSKVTRACDRCKQRKRRCNGQWPCDICASYRADCAYDAIYRRGKLVRPSTHSDYNDNRPSASSVAAHATAESVVPATTDAELADTDNEAAGGAIGQSSAYAFLKRAWTRFNLREGRDIAILSLPGLQDDGQSSIFSFGDRRASTVAPQLCSLPSSAVAGELFALYFDFAMPTYRFLHRPTVASWLEDMLLHLADAATVRGTTASQRAVVWLLLATSTVFKHTSANGRHDDSKPITGEAERYFAAAEYELSCERGRPKLESVQARLAMCLYLLHASMPNTAWYEFGTTVQLALVLGLHRKTKETNLVDIIACECRKRTFWALTTLDTYLSVLLGRPSLINDRDISQDYPRAIDDEQLLHAQEMSSGRDCVIEASIWHARLARITKAAALSQTRPGQAEENRLHAAIKTTGELAAWRAALPTVLSGAVQPSSLIAIFRRQVVVLQLGYFHAVMLITRPLLLLDPLDSPSLRDQIGLCIKAAASTLDLLSTWADDGTTFAAFWLTQYVAFNAVSIIYVYVIQLRGNTSRPMTAEISVDDLLPKASKVQKRFAEIAALNAPSLRYYAVLQELERAVNVPLQEEQRLGQSVTNADVEMPVYETSNLSDSLDLDFWLQLDSFPFSDTTFDDAML